MFNRISNVFRARSAETSRRDDAETWDGGKPQPTRVSEEWRVAFSAVNQRDGRSALEIARTAGLKGRRQVRKIEALQAAMKRGDIIPPPPADAD